ncbi:hypothetical protein NMG29_11295 [Streptomyces cocklensis]|uniref:Uncharacterized protein n=1 Tax=Actinacidiphila cocklensis TaxID=887465 RepID=A0A9W4E0V9_9ACTN|nr:hypothetical protein [Actinacidiphila cocklensis]MDD1058792.1 hypothetical protein [Actinacidiphila cocklensis]CAG6398912.1 conserved membrane hypothetical protein [Actinacidiphila cocklensis]
MVLLLALLIPAGLVAGFGLVGYGCSTLVRAGGRRSGRNVWLRCLAAFLGAVAAAAYAWGLVVVGFAVLDAEDGGTDSSPLRPCRAPGDPGRAWNVVDYTVGYVPLRFVCVNQDGSSYTPGTVPGYVNPAAQGFGLAAAACAVAATRRSQRGVPKGAAAQAR